MSEQLAYKESIEYLEERLDECQDELDELREICVKTYLCYAISERCTMYKPVQQAWDIGQKIYNERKVEGKAL